MTKEYQEIRLGKFETSRNSLKVQGVKCSIYSYIWKTVLYIPIFQGKQEILNSYLKQMMLISNMERCKFVNLQHLLSNSHFFKVWHPCLAQPSLFNWRFFPGMNVGKLTYKSTGESILLVK